MKKRHLFLLFFVFTHVCFFSETLILKVKSAPSIVGWVYQKGKLENSYCLYDRNYLLLASTSGINYNKNPIFNIFKEHEEAIISSNFSISNTHFVSLDEANIVVEHSFNDPSYSKVRCAHEKLKALSIAISPDDGTELVGFENGFIQVHSLLKKSKKNIDLYFKGHKEGVYSIKFNSLGEYFISSGLDDSVKVWNSKDLKLLTSFPAFTKGGFSSFFSHLKDNFVYLQDEKMLVVSNISGDESSTIFVNDGIKIASFTENQNKMAILTQNGRLLFYSISTGKPLGELTSSSNSPIHSFSINIVSGDIVLGTETGEVYLYHKDELKSVNVAKNNKKTKKQEKNSLLPNETKENEVDKKLIDKEIDYWGLEDAPTVKDTSKGKPSFSIKDETPLEEPMEVLPKSAKVTKEVKATPAKNLNATVFDDDDVDFPKNESQDKRKQLDALPLKDEDKNKKIEHKKENDDLLEDDEDSKQPNEQSGEELKEEESKEEESKDEKDDSQEEESNEGGSEE